MGDEEKKAKRKEKMQNAGSTIGNIVKIIKRMANPIIRWTAIVILIIVLLIGVIGFIISFPSGILGKLTGNIFGWVERDSNKIYNVSDDDLITLCEYLEEMGIKDLEGYGFVEEIKRREPTINEENGLQTSKGEITSVKSKYLEAYLIAERKTYVIDDNLLNATENSDYDRLIFDLAFGVTFESYWDIGNNDKGIFEEAIQEMYNLEDEKYKINEDIKQDIEKYQDSEFSEFNKDEIREKVETMLLAYFKEEKYGKKENEEAYYYGKKLIELTGEKEEFKKQFEQALNNNISLEIGQYSKEDLIGRGLIHIVGSALNGTQVVTGENNEHKISINKDKRQLIISTQQIDGLWSKILAAFNLATTYNYAYDLNNWVCKYGKPVEFLVSLHLATGAPDFVYQVATSPAVDTRVYVDLFPVSNSLSLVTEEGGNTTAKQLIEDACDSIFNSYKNEALRQIRYIRDAITMEDFDCYFIFYTGNAFEWKCNDVQSATSLDTLISKWNDLKELLEDNGYSCGYLYGKSSADSVKIKLSFGGATYEYNYNEIQEIKEQVDKYESQSWNSATPYITKVVNHWYRNQYFTKKDATIDLSTKKTRIKKAINTVSIILSEEELKNGISTPPKVTEAEDIAKNDLEVIYEDNSNSTIPEEVNEAIEEAIGKLENLEEEGLGKYLEDQRKNFVNLTESEDKKTQIKNEFEATKKEITGKVAGSAYTIIGSPEPFWQSIAETSTDDFGGEVAGEFMKKLWIKETRGADIIQIHNPIFEDNSQYIRNWLKEKYYIYADPNTSEENTAEANTTEGNTTTTKALSDSKISQGKQYIDGKRALQELETMIEQCDGERKDISYMLRDVKELFEDFEFDLENVEVPAEKVLDNVMPDYVPYTPWPSIYETAEDNCTKMIYKTTEESKLIAPAQGIITKAQDNIIEIKFSSDDEKTSSTNGMILNIEIEEGRLEPSKSESSDVKRGKEIGKVNPNSEGMIILKLRLFSATKQLLKIQNYMTVNSKSYDGENSIEEQEKIYLYNLQETEIDIKTNGWFGTGGERQETITSRVALMNIIFNKISSPYYPEYKDIKSILGTTGEAKRNNFFSYAKNNGPSRNTKLDQLENKNIEGKYAIKNALAGVDITKSYTLIGATQYIPLDSNYYLENNVDSETKDGKLQDAEELIIKFQLGNRMLGITREEYTDYLGNIIDKKINEVIYTLNIKKYTQGFEEYNEVIAQFEKAKKVVVGYYEKGTFVDDCSNGQVIESMRIVTNISKSNIYQEVEDIEGQEGKQTVTDKFTITANSNYSTIWTFTYTKGAEGKIEGDITVENKPIKNI